MLVQLPNGDYVNPDFVTSIKYVSGPTQHTPGRTQMWVVGDAGYHTYSISFAGDQRDDLAKLLARPGQRKYKVCLGSHGGSKIACVKWVMDISSLVGERIALVKAKGLVEESSEPYVKTLTLPFLFTKEQCEQVNVGFYAKCPLGHIEIKKV